MKIDEAIGRIRDHMERHGIGEYPHVKLGEALEMVIAVIKKLKSTEPLTVEQIKAMENAEPVWWKSASMWCLAQNGNIITPSGQCYDAELYPRDFYSYPLARIDKDDRKPCNLCSLPNGQPARHLILSETCNGEANFCPECGRPITKNSRNI